MSDTVTLRVQPFRSYKFIFMATILIQQCSNDNTVFLLDYLYYNVCETGCRFFFDHYYCSVNIESISSFVTGSGVKIAFLLFSISTRYRIYCISTRHFSSTLHLLHQASIASSSPTTPKQAPGVLLLNCYSQPNLNLLVLRVYEVLALSCSLRISV